MTIPPTFSLDSRRRRRAGLLVVLACIAGLVVPALHAWHVIAHHTGGVVSRSLASVQVAGHDESEAVCGICQLFLAERGIGGELTAPALEHAERCVWIHPALASADFFSRFCTNWCYARGPPSRS